MMIHAYQEIYLSNAQAALGDAFDYAVNTCGITGSDFTKLFVVSTISRRMENGEPKFLSGKSGIEIVRDVVLETMGKELSPPHRKKTCGAPVNTGLAGQSHITNGIPQENTAIFSR